MLSQVCEQGITLVAFRQIQLQFLRFGIECGPMTAQEAEEVMTSVHD